MNRILVTGGAGFIGSNFVHYCLNKNDKVLKNVFVIKPLKDS